MGFQIPRWEGAILGKVRPLYSIGTLCSHLCENGWTGDDAVWIVGSEWPKESWIRSGPGPQWEGAKGRPLWSIGTFCCELCRNGRTCRFAVWVVDLGGPKETWVQLYLLGGANVHNFNRIRQVVPMCPDGRAHWCNLANTIKPSVCGSDAVVC